MKRMVLDYKQYNSVFSYDDRTSYDIQFVTFIFLLRFENVNLMKSVLFHFRHLTKSRNLSCILVIQL